VFYRKQAVPYFIALISHSLIADFFIGGQLLLFWPVTTQKAQQLGLHELGSIYIDIESPLNVAIELTLLLAATVIMFRNGDILQFFKAKRTNLMLIIPIFTVLLPTFVGYPFDAPILETLPAAAIGHVFFIVLFTASVLIALNGIARRNEAAAC
jgi:hypothetical protein